MYVPVSKCINSTVFFALSRGTWRNFNTRNGDEDFMHSLPLLSPGIWPRHSSSQRRSPGLPSLRMEHSPRGLGWNRKIVPRFTSFSLHLGLSPRLSVSGVLRRAVKSAHVSLAGSSIRAELRVTSTHLLRSDILRRRLASIAVTRHQDFDSHDSLNASTAGG